MSVPTTIIDKFSRIILLNELDGSTAHAYKFSDADGVRSGKSGYSFGLSQFDIHNNPEAIHCLRECGFTTDEITALKKQTILDLTPFKAKLKAHAEVINRYDDNQFGECIQWPPILCREGGISFDDSGLLAMADYHNQFYMSRRGKLHKHLMELGRIVTAEDVYKFKLALPWGIKRPDDVIRRHNNIMRVIAEG